MRWHAAGRGFKPIQAGGRVDCQCRSTSIPLTIRSCIDSSEIVYGAATRASSQLFGAGRSVGATVASVSMRASASVHSASSGATSTSEVAGVTTVAGATGAAAGISSIAERLRSAASRKLPQTISPPTKTPRSTMTALDGGGDNDAMTATRPCAEYWVGYPAVMCPFGHTGP